MKWMMNVARVILAFFIPGFVFIYLSSLLDFDAEPFTILTAILSGLFATEIMARQMGEQRIWTAISKSAKDKFVFTIGLILFGVFSAFPEYLDANPRSKSLPVLLLGILVMFAVFKLFGSKQMNEALSRPRKKRDSESSRLDG